MLIYLFLKSYTGERKATPQLVDMDLLLVMVSVSAGKENGNCQSNLQQGKNGTIPHVSACWCV